MAKARTTVSIDENILRAVKIRAARTGKADGQIIEDAVRQHLGLDLLERPWDRNDLSEGDAMALALEAQRAARSSRPQS